VLAPPVLAEPSKGILSSDVPWDISFLAFFDLFSLTCGLISVSTGACSGSGAFGGAGGGGGGANGGGSGIFIVGPPKHIRFLPP
jgi:hypothetical protein